MATILQITYTNTFLERNVWISNRIAVIKKNTCLIDDKPALFQVMACCLFGDKPLPKPMMTQLIAA